MSLVWLRGLRSIFEVLLIIFIGLKFSRKVWVRDFNLVFVSVLMVIEVLLMGDIIYMEYDSNKRGLRIEF